ncbi:MAG: GNAT family N-acetyltransferase [Acidobacteriota bacterium]|nr:GNAT family N-acetyltransferase [Blastocatellia bacterium]MDW8240512.1 GNAT family N-acetyltransferase [Acidobacteriota bacterium]
MDNKAQKPRLPVRLRLAQNNADDSRRFCELSNALYVRKVDEAYYRWQFFDTPFPSLLMMAMTEDDQLAGCYAYHLRSLAATGEPLAMALDIMVAPQFQRQGVFRALAHEALSQMQRYNPVAAYVMANERADQAHVHGLGWRRVNRLADWICSTATVADAERHGVSVIPIRMLTPDDEQFINQVEQSRRSKQLFAFSRSAVLLTWRFLRNPRYAYELFRCEHRGHLFGFLVLKTFRDPVSGQGLGDIVDLIWAEDDPDVLSQILKFALNYFHRRRLDRAVAWFQTNTVLDQVGEALGFAPTDRYRNLCCSVLNEDYLALEEASRWFLTPADTDLY